MTYSTCKAIAHSHLSALIMPREGGARCPSSLVLPDHMPERVLRPKAPGVQSQILQMAPWGQVDLYRGGGGIPRSCRLFTEGATIEALEVPRPLGYFASKPHHKVAKKARSPAK